MKLKCPACNTDSLNPLRILLWTQKCSNCKKRIKLVLPLKYNILCQLVLLVTLWSVFVYTGGTAASLVIILIVAIIMIAVMLKVFLRYKIC